MKPWPPYGTIHPFWFWNDQLTAAEIQRQIAEMAAQGVNGFFIHSRQGLRQPYLSDAFFEMVAVAVEAAERHGLTVHLYDEFPYPSGVAGGEVIQGNPHFWATDLQRFQVDIDGGDVELVLPEGQVLACCGCPLDASGAIAPDAARDLRSAVGWSPTDETYVVAGLTAYNRKRFFSSQPRPVLATSLPAGRWRIFAAIQTVVRDHKYWGQFVDVMNPAAVQRFIELTHGRYAARFREHFGNRIRSIFVDETVPRWTDSLPARYAARYGSSLLAALPAWFSGDPAISYRLQQLQLDLFRETFEQPIGDWCRAHDLAYTGEKPSWRLSQLQHMDIPGCEPGHTKAGSGRTDMLGRGIRQNARATASAAYFYDKPASLCECYHSLGWSGTLLDAKLIGEGLLLMGIHWLVPHGFFYSTHALRKHDAPPTFFFQMPAWRLFGRLSARFAEIGEAFADTWIEASILIVEPSPGLPTPAQAETYERLQLSLMARQLDFLHVDVDILAAGHIADGHVHCRAIAASHVVVPPMQIQEPELSTWVTDFVAAGGNVVQLSADSDIDTVVSRLHAELGAARAFEVAAGDAAQLWSVTRTDGRRRRWLLLNQRAEPLQLELASQVAVIDSAPVDLRGRVLHLAAFESVLLSEAAAAPVTDLPRLTVTVSSEARLTAERPNLLRLYDWQFELLAADGAASASVSVPAVPLSNQLELARVPVVPVWLRPFGVSPTLSLPPLQVRYSCEFRNDFDGAVWLLMEPESILGAWTLWVNDQPLTPAALQPSDRFLPGCLDCEISPWLRSGANRLVVELTAERQSDGLRNALYLAGAFGVDAVGPVLRRPDVSGRFEDYEKNGLPYYAGPLVYTGTVVLRDVPDSEVLLTLAFPEPFRQACEVAFNHGAWLPLPWSPRRLLVPAGQLHNGDNELRVRVLTTLIGAFEGARFDEVSHTTCEVRTVSE